MFNKFALTKAEFNSRLKFTCVHSHNGLAHPRCYDRANGLDEKVGYFDIEASNLSSDFGIVLCYCIKHDGGTISNKITPREIKDGTHDKRLLKDLCKDLRKFDRVITWYGSKFDLPFVRSRSILFKLNFPIFQEVKHTDAYMVAKRILRTLHSKRLGVVADFYGIKAKEHPLKPTIWIKCLSGNQKAIDFVETHCKEDVTSLQEVCERAIFPYTKLRKSSV